MSLATTLQKVEECIERDVLDFFRLLGASEAPEDWDCPAAAPIRSIPRQAHQTALILLLGQDQLVVAGKPQPVLLSGMADANLFSMGEQGT